MIQPRFTHKEGRALADAIMAHHHRSQPCRIATAIARHGYVDNFSAVDGVYDGIILRLGAIIHRLRHDNGLDILTLRGFEIPGCPTPKEKNTYYFFGDLRRHMAKNDATYNDFGHA